MEKPRRKSLKTVGDDIDIVYTGLRPGEKLHEELFHEMEALESTEHEKILKAQRRELMWETLVDLMDKLIRACENADEKKLHELLLSLVPEWRVADVR